MSWFKGLKISMPMLEEPPASMTYHSIGHDKIRGVYGKETDEEMWYIDRNWTLHREPTADSGDRMTHMRIWGDDVTDKQYVARGRYAKTSDYPLGAASVIFGYIGEDATNFRAFEYKQKRVIKILESTYGSQVTIMRF